MTREKAEAVADVLERWMQQRSRMARPSHNRCGQHHDDDVDFRELMVNTLAQEP